jgi:hypothetical protein
MAKTLVYDVSPHELRLRIEAKVRNPNVGRVISAPLKSGPQSYRFATLFQIINPSSNEHHHWCLRIDSFSRTKKIGWLFKPERSVVLDDDGASELADLSGLVQAALGGHLNQETGEYELVPAAHLQNIRTLIRFARRADAPQRMRVVQALLQNLDVDSIEPAEWLRVFEAGGDSIRQIISASSRLVEYRRVRERLAGMISSTAVREQELQTLLAEHPWLFGSEYSELLERRAWTRDDRLDFMLRRTADDYLEVVEIKTPFKDPLFRYDASHDSYAPSSPLSSALGQVIRYIDEIERGRDAILAKNGCDTLKIRARIIIGCDGDAGQQAALRNFNGHLHRIEVLTFDQLLRIADRVLSIFSGALQGSADVGAG